MLCGVCLVRQVHVDDPAVHGDIHSAPSLRQGRFVTNTSMPYLWPVPPVPRPLLCSRVFRARYLPVLCNTHPKNVQRTRRAATRCGRGGYASGTWSARGQTRYAQGLGSDACRTIDARRAHVCRVACAVHAANVAIVVLYTPSGWDGMDAPEGNFSNHTYILKTFIILLYVKHLIVTHPPMSPQGMWGPQGVSSRPTCKAAPSAKCCGSVPERRAQLCTP